MSTGNCKPVNLVWGWAFFPQPTAKQPTTPQHRVSTYFFDLFNWSECARWGRPARSRVASNCHPGRCQVQRGSLIHSPPPPLPLQAFRLQGLRHLSKMRIKRVLEAKLEPKPHQDDRGCPPVPTTFLTVPGQYPCRTLWSFSRDSSFSDLAHVAPPVIRPRCSPPPPTRPTTISS